MKVHGKNAAFKLQNAGGTLEDISAWLTQVDFPETVDTAETSAFGTDAKTYIAGMTGYTVKLTGQWDSAANTPEDVISGVKGGTHTPAFEFGPSGTATGNVKYSGTAIITSFQRTAPIGGVVTFSADMIGSGPYVKGTY